MTANIVEVKISLSDYGAYKFVAEVRRREGMNKVVPISRQYFNEADADHIFPTVLEPYFDKGLEGLPILVIYFDPEPEKKEPVREKKWSNMWGWI